MKTRLAFTIPVVALATLGGFVLEGRRGNSPGIHPARHETTHGGGGATYGTELVIDHDLWPREKELGRPANEASLMSRALYNQGRFAESFAAADRAIALARYWQRGLLVEEAHRLQGRNLVEMGQYRRALPYLDKDYRIGQSEALDLDLTLCYLKLGDPERARRHYSDQLVLRYNHDLAAKDLPGTGNTTALEASIRFARALDLDTSSRKTLAAAEYARAEALAPNNRVIPYYRGLSLHYAGHDDLAAAHFVKAALMNEGGPGSRGWNARSHLTREGVEMLEREEKARAARLKAKG